MQNDPGPSKEASEKPGEAPDQHARSVPDAWMPTAKSRLLALLDYIEQVERFQSRPTLVVPVEFYCAFEEELHDLPGLEIGEAAGPDSPWLRVACLEPHDPPNPPEALQPWIILGKNPGESPRLREALTVPGLGEEGAPVTLLRGDDPRLGPLFNRYVSGDWADWARIESARRKTMAVYDRLFGLHQSVQAEGAAVPLELVWGIGMALWNHPGGQRLAHPLITQPVEVGLDRETLALEIRPRSRAPALELEPYLALRASGVAHLERAWQVHLEAAELPLSPFDRSGFEDLLKNAASSLDPQGVYWPEAQARAHDRSLPAFARHLIVTDTWVLFARKRSPNLLIEDVERLRESIAEAATLPAGPASLVCEPSTARSASAQAMYRGLGDTMPADAAERPKELFFPKPYNAEQVSIVRKLQTSPAVVVHGPPGTGKTHTIANIICHTLASGGRVLVTSKGEPALAVLRDHIPDPLRPLSVALLTEEKEGMEQFKRAVHTIAVTVARIDPVELGRAADELRAEIDQLHSRIAQIDKDMTACAELHLNLVQFNARLMTPAELARYVAERENEYSWFPDKLAASPPRADFSEPALGDEDLVRARTARRVIGPDLPLIEDALPPLRMLPDAGAIARIHEDLQRERALAAAMRAQELPELVRDGPASADELGELLSLLQEAERVLARSGDARTGFAAVTVELYRKSRAGPSGAVSELDEVAAAARALDGERHVFLRRPVHLPLEAELDAEFLQALQRVRRGKHPLGILHFGKSGLRALLAAVRIAGTPPQGPQDWSHVADYLEFMKRVRAAAARWRAVCADLGIQLPPAVAPLAASQDPPFPSGAGGKRHEAVAPRISARPTLAPDAPPALRLLRALRDQVEDAAAIRRLVTEVEPRISKLALRLFGSKAGTLALTPGGLERLRDSTAKHLERLQRAYSARIVSELVGQLAAARGALAAAVRQFLTIEIGNAARTTASIVDQWAVLLADLQRLERLRPEFEVLKRAAQRVEAAGAPRWARELLSIPPGANDDPCIPEDWRQAWHWRQAAAFLEGIEARESLRRLQTERREAEHDLQRAYRMLIERTAWLQIHRNCPPAVTAALHAYLNAVQHTGKGNGLRAARYRREARAAMRAAHRAIPCWIMPHWRVSETLPSEIGQFDLVVIDEASQSDLWALPSLLRARKLVIVGDDRQVSPDPVDLEEERIRDLKERFLKAQVFGDQMTPEKSIYDLARVAFSDNLVVLREHFRCARPIIEFSKREFYQHELQPLRVPKASERLDPPLVDVHIKGARRRGNVNEAEARAVVNEIKLIIADPRCAGRTVGVVSLLGMEQARRIFQLLRQEVSAQEILARHMTVGDARTFQGKERDIMLLSMVATPELKVSATGVLFQQRFNVAATRARDQMILFRSLDAADLNAADLQATLIEHFHAPYGAGREPAANQRDRCASAFERELYDELHVRGYRVLVHVPAGNDTIDLVVEDDQDHRLAIECDGDQYHSMTRWQSSTARQRVLERAGWTVWRGFAMTFVRHRQAVLDDLLNTVRTRAIAPVGTAARTAQSYTEHRIIHAADILGPLQPV